MIAVSLVALAANMRGQIMAAGDLPPVPGPTVTEHLTGVVLNSVTGQPVPGVLITAPGRPLAVLTDFQGRFPLDLTRVAQSGAGAAPQQSMPLAFEIRKPGYLTRASLASVPYYASTTASSPVELLITPAAVISGRIESETGVLPPSTTVMLFRRQVVQGRGSWIQAETSQTNSHGEYRFANLHPGNYKVGSFGFNPGGRAHTDAPAADGLLPAFYPNSDNLDSAAPVHVKAGDSADINLTLRSAILYRVVVPVVLPPQTGTSFGGALSVPPGIASGPAAAAMGVQAVILPQSFGFDLTYDRRSNAFIGFLPVGSYDVRFLTNGPAPSSGSVHLSVAGAPVTSAAVVLHPAAQVQVFVRWDSPPANVPDNRQQNYFYSFEALEPASIASRRPERSGDIYRDPNVSIADMTEGLYRFVMTGIRGYVASAVSGTTDLLRDPLRVGPGESPQPIQVALRNDGASLHVTVADSATTATVGTVLHPELLAMILGIPLDQPERQPVFQFVVHSTAAGAGSNLSNLAPGRYLVLAIQQDPMTNFSPEFRNPDVLAQLMSKGVVINLSANENAAIQVPLLPAEVE